MKKLICLLISAVLLGAWLPAAGEEEMKEVRCDEWGFSLRIPAGAEAAARTCEDWDTEREFAGGLAIFAAGEDGAPRIQVMRRNRFYNITEYLDFQFSIYLEQYGESETEDCRLYTLGGRTLYGNTGTVYGEQGGEAFREIRLIPADGSSGTEFIARYTAGTEEETMKLLETVIRGYRPKEAPEEAAADFRPEGDADGIDLQHGSYLLRTEDTDKIGTEGYFTAVLYRPDRYTPEDVRAMKPGDTIRILDRVLTITDIEAYTEEDGSIYEAELYAAGGFPAAEHYCFTLMRNTDGTAYRPYFGEDLYSASRAGEIRIRVPQEQPIGYYREEEYETIRVSEDLLGNPGNGLDLTVAGWNEYTHRCVFTDGRPVRIETWSYPDGPEDLITSWDE